jgi:4-amino-4-deoxy-L-arabinose transferase-like glycosyltransferase
LIRAFKEFCLLKEENRKSPGLYVLCLIAILLVAFVLRLGDFNERWPGKGWQSLNGFFSIIARNYVEQGYMPLKFGPATNPFPPEDGEWDIYLHHPPLFPLLISFSFLIFGIAEWSARLLPVVASMIELYLIWLIACHLFRRRVGLACAALGATIPVTAFYGSHVIQVGSVLMAFSCAAFLFHLKHLERPIRRNFIFLAIMLCGAAMTDWHGYFMGGAIILHYFWCKKWREAFWLIGLMAALILLHLLHLYWATGSVGGGFAGSLQEIFLHRTWGGIQELGGMEKVVPGIAGNFITVYTWPVMILALLGLLTIHRSARPMAIIALILAGLLDNVIFLEGSMRHDFWCITMAPALIVLAGAGIVAAISVVPLKRMTEPILCAAVAVIALYGAYETHIRFEKIEDDFFYVLAGVIEEHTEPDDMIGTCEHNSRPLLFYSRHNIIGLLRDETLPPEGLPDSLTPFQKIIIPEFKSRPHNHDRLLNLLLQKYPCKVVHKKECGDIHIFDVTKKF